MSSLAPSAVLARRFDLIYSAGLLDYLLAETASPVARSAHEHAHALGRASGLQLRAHNYGRGYMEGMMGWSLIYRSEAELQSLLDSKRTPRVYRDEPGNVVYLEASSHLN